MSCVTIKPGFAAHPSGALWLPNEETAILADAHLGYGWAQRRRGELGPVQDGGGLRNLLALIDDLSPRRLVFLGDTVHAPHPAPAERALVEATLNAAASRTDVILAAGNHDRAFRRDFGGLGLPVVSKWESAGITALHGDRLPERWNGTLVVGHLHPSIALREASGVSRRFRLFLYTAAAIVLPAFSPFAAGCDIRRRLPPEWRALLNGGRMDAIAVTGRTAAPVPRAQLPRPATQA